MPLFGNKKKKPVKHTCMFCQKDLTEKELKTNEVKYEHAEGESSLGFICDKCADVLDQIQSKEDDNQWAAMNDELDLSKPWYEPIEEDEDER